jgi:hypothetical protein
MQKKQTILVVASLLVVVLSVTLAYFTAQIIGKRKNVTINSADLKIIFTDSDGSISGTNIEPGKWNVTKTFTIENKSNETYKYNIVIQDLVNTFVTNGYLQYKITSTNGGYNMAEFKDVPKSETATDTILAYSASIDVGVTQTYTVEFIYKNDESVDQSEDMGKTLSGKLFITEGTINIYAGYEKGTLGYQIMGDNITRLTRSNNNNGTNDFATPLTTTTTGTLFTSTESITGITDSPKEIYYYAGNTTNNWVKFGILASDGPIRGYDSANSTKFKEYTTLDECNSASSYNTNCSYAWRKGDPMYWRIIRTNHDGSIRLLYAGANPDTTAGNIGTIAFNKNDNSPKYVGYKYGEDTSLDTIRNNTTDSTIKTYVDNWYKNNLTNYTKYLSTSAVYCNDRSLGTGQTYSASSDSEFNFATYYRMDFDTKGAKANPSYNCTDIRDAFSVDNTSAKLIYPVALMTADEIVYAGGVANKKMNTPYAWFQSNSVGTEVSTYWWSLSPNDWSGTGSRVWDWAYVDVGFRADYVDNAFLVRPAISLKSCIKYGAGNGSAETPYEIVETSSGC